MIKYGFLYLSLLIIFANASLRAEIIAGRWEKLDGQPSGRQIIITLKTGERVEGLLKNSGAGDIALSDSSGRELTIQKSEVSQIVGRDPTWDGTLSGFLLGFAGGAAMGGAMAAKDDWVAKFTIPFWGAIGGGAGALVGRAADKSRKGTEVLYRSR